MNRLAWHELLEKKDLSKCHKGEMTEPLKSQVNENHMQLIANSYFI